MHFNVKATLWRPSRRVFRTLQEQGMCTFADALCATSVISRRPVRRMLFLTHRSLSGWQAEMTGNTAESFCLLGGHGNLFTPKGLLEPSAGFLEWSLHIVGPSSIFVCGLTVVPLYNESFSFTLKILWSPQSTEGSGPLLRLMPVGSFPFLLKAGG